MIAIVTIGIDLAKNLFAVHGVDATGKLAFTRLSAHQAERYRARMSEAALSATNRRCHIGEAVVQRWS